MSLLTALARHSRRHRRPPPPPTLFHHPSSPLLLGQHDDDDDTAATTTSHDRRQQRRRRHFSTCLQYSCDNYPPQYHHHHHHQEQQQQQYSIKKYTTGYNNNNIMTTTTRTRTPNTAPSLNNSNNINNITNTRTYHTSSPKPILPFLAAGLVGATGIYTYRALQQLDLDWEEYYEKVEEYKEKTGLDPEAMTSYDGNANINDSSNTATTTAMGDLASHFQGGTMAIDMGTTRLKLSHRKPPSPSDTNLPIPEVSADREGFRSTPSLVWFPPNENDNENSNENGGDGGDDNVLVGRLAASHHRDVINPREALQLLSMENNNNDNNNNNSNNNAASSLAGRAAREAIRASALNALDQVLGGSSGGSSGGGKSKQPLFVLDSSMAAIPGSYNVRPIFTYPPPSTNTTLSTFSSNNTYLERYQQAMNDLTYPPGIAAFVPEPIAIVTGAEYYNLLPPPPITTTTTNDNNESVLVVDVGGTCTTVSMVSSTKGGEKEVTYAASLPFGGDTFIDLLVSHLIQGFYGTTATTTTTTDNATAPLLSSKPHLNDPTALQRLYEASTTAMHELSRNTRSQINIPYLTMDSETRQPRHLDVGMARNVVDSQVDEYIRRHLVPHLANGNGGDGSNANANNNANTNNNATILSQALPPPTNLSTLFSSLLMSTLEQTSHTPQMVRGIVLVGGGARIPLVKNAMIQSVGYLAGEERMLVTLEGEMTEELGVLGAVVWGSGGGAGGK